MATDTVPIFDADRLHRQTMGDGAMQVEVLSLFVAEAQRLMQQVEAAPDPQTRGERLRALAALGRNTGALRLMQAARLAEGHAGDPDLGAVRAALSDTLAYVQRVGV